MAASEASREAAWLRQILTEMGFSITEPIIIYSDSQSAMQIIENPVHHAKSKHIDVRFHYVRDQVMEEKVSFEYLETSKMIADSLTKGVPEDKTTFCRTGLGVEDLKTGGQKI